MIGARRKLSVILIGYRMRAIPAWLPGRRQSSHGLDGGREEEGRASRDSSRSTRPDSRAWHNLRHSLPERDRRSRGLFVAASRHGLCHERRVGGGCRPFGSASEETTMVRWLSVGGVLVLGLELLVACGGSVAPPTSTEGPASEG